MESGKMWCFSKRSTHCNFDLMGICQCNSYEPYWSTMGVCQCNSYELCWSTMGVCQCNSYELCWSTMPAFYMSGIRNLIFRNWFLAILINLHCLPRQAQRSKERQSLQDSFIVVIIDILNSENKFNAIVVCCCVILNKLKSIYKPQ